MKMLIDIDDGTIDGNQRVHAESGTDFVTEDSDGDGGRGDGTIDMSDFRRWARLDAPESRHARRHSERFGFAP